MKLTSLESLSITGTTLSRGRVLQSGASETSGAAGNRHAGRDVGNCRAGRVTDLGTLYPPCCNSPPGATALLPLIYRQRERQVKGKAETATCHAKATQRALCFCKPLVQERMPRVIAQLRWLPPPRPHSKHGPAVLDRDAPVSITGSRADQEHKLTTGEGLHQSALQPSVCTCADSNACRQGPTGLGKAVPRLGCFLRQIRKQIEALGCDPAVSGLFDSSPGPVGVWLWLIPCSSARRFCMYPKPQPSTERLVSHRAAACHVCFPCQNPQAPPHSRRKREG